MSFCHVDLPHVLLTVIKRAEDGAGVVLRLVETEGRSTAVTLTMSHLTLVRAWQTNLVEENQAELTCTEHSVTAPVKAFGVTTLRLATR
jgi:alpha-mannosidase